MADTACIPTALFGIPLDIAPEPRAAELPRMFARDFHLLRGALLSNPPVEFGIVASLERPDTKMALSAAEQLAKVTGLPSLICSPELEPWQKERIAREGAAFAQDARNVYAPFLGIAIAENPGAGRAAKTLSPQAQRMFANLFSGEWDGLNAGSLADLMGKSRPSVSNYLAEIAAVSPSLVETEGRERRLANPGFERAELLERFEPFLASPVKCSFKVASLDPRIAADLGFLVAGRSALELKTDLAFDRGSLVFASNKEGIERLGDLLGEDLRELPLHADEGTLIQEWAYPVDFPDERHRLATGMDSVDDLGLYLSLRDAAVDDVRVEDAIDQVRSALCQS